MVSHESILVPIHWSDLIIYPLYPPCLALQCTIMYNDQQFGVPSCDGTMYVTWDYSDVFMLCIYYLEPP